MTQSVPKTQTPADRAHLLRVIARLVAEALPAPMVIEIDPAAGYANLRFDDGAVAAVGAWADMLGVEVVQHDLDIEALRGPGGKGSHWVGNGDAGTEWHGWKLHIWCMAAGSAR
ncbi:hypothetical protein AB0M35_18165 [Micromonospora sp. NPDC051196]|uniref:hypothetical protein n=1 Tax=Micromonospora sp. NPDC051196 TaxID=3155281 RepID=UPI003436FDA0